MSDEDEKIGGDSYPLLIKKRKAFIYQLSQGGEVNDFSVLDPDVDDWLYNAYKPSPYPLERKEFRLRDREKPKDAYINNGRKKK
jgi:hypothetical protein